MLAGTPVEFDEHCISMELKLSSQSSCQAFLLVLHVCPRSHAFYARSAAIMHCASRRNRRGTVIRCQTSPLGASRSEPNMCSPNYANGPITFFHRRTITARLHRCSPLGQTAHLLLIQVIIGRPAQRSLSVLRQTTYSCAVGCRCFQMTTRRCIASGSLSAISEATQQRSCDSQTTSGLGGSVMGLIG
jgi:hypothetical protein